MRVPGRALRCMCHVFSGLARRALVVGGCPQSIFACRVLPRVCRRRGLRRPAWDALALKFFDGLCFCFSIREVCS